MKKITKGVIFIYKLTDEQKELAGDNVELAYWCGNKWSEKLGLERYRKELQGRCIIGLVKASKTYNPKYSKFSTYAVKCMDNEVKMWLRKQNKRNSTFSFSDLEGDNKKGDKMPIEVIAKELQVDSSSDDLINSMWLQSAILDLDRLETKILYWYYYKDLTQVEISKKIGYSQSYVSRLLKKTLRKLEKFYIRENKEVSI